MKRDQQKEQTLLKAERELYELLMRLLPICAERGTLIFFNATNTPEEYQLRWLPPESDELLELANCCIALRSQLGLPIAQTVPQLFLDACEEQSNQMNPHRRGPRKLAAWLHAELQSRI